MTQNTPHFWDIGRFVETLNYFGEVPLLGNIQWIQELFGKSPNPVGKVLSAAQENRMILVLGAMSETGQLFSKRLMAEGLPLRLQVPNLDAARLEFGASANLVSETVTEESLLWMAGGAKALVICPGVEVWPDWISAIGEQAKLSRPWFDFTDDQAKTRIPEVWGAVDDVVMGGVSSSGLSWVPGGFARFSGTVSTANSGGFSSVRSRNFDPAFNLSDWQGLRLRLRGDGQRYKVILRDTDAWDSPAHTFSVDTQADTWQTVDIPFDQLIPTFRAKTIPNGTPLNLGHVTALQLMLSKFEYDGSLNPHFQPGPFSLDIESVSVYTDQPQPQLFVLRHEPFEEPLQTAWDQANQLPRQVLMADSPAALAETGADVVAALVEAM